MYICCENLLLYRSQQMKSKRVQSTLDSIRVYDTSYLPFVTIFSGLNLCSRYMMRCKAQIKIRNPQHTIPKPLPLITTIERVKSPRRTFQFQPPHLPLCPNTSSLSSSCLHQTYTLQNTKPECKYPLIHPLPSRLSSHPPSTPLIQPTSTPP